VQPVELGQISWPATARKHPRFTCPV